MLVIETSKELVQVCEGEESGQSLSWNLKSWEKDPVKYEETLGTTRLHIEGRDWELIVNGQENISIDATKAKMWTWNKK